MNEIIEDSVAAVEQPIRLCFCSFWGKRRRSMGVMPMEKRIPNSRRPRQIAWRKEQSESASACVHLDLEFGDVADASFLLYLQQW